MIQPPAAEPKLVRFKSDGKRTSETEHRGRAIRAASLDQVLVDNRCVVRLDEVQFRSADADKRVRMYQSRIEREASLSVLRRGSRRKKKSRNLGSRKQVAKLRWATPSRNNLPESSVVYQYVLLGSGRAAKRLNC